MKLSSRAKGVLRSLFIIRLPTRDPSTSVAGVVRGLQCTRGEGIYFLLHLSPVFLDDSDSHEHA